MKCEAKNRSRILILSHICQFSLGRDIGGSDYAGLSYMRFHNTTNPDIGSLVALNASSPSKWYLSWVYDVKIGTTEFDTIYTLESIETGELCDWSNVSILQYDKTQTDAHPSWRWTDKQHEFNDRWMRACYKRRDAYITLPIYPDFTDNDGEVYLGVRGRFNSGPIVKRCFPNWKKLTVKSMLEFYDEAVLKRGESKPHNFGDNPEVIKI